MINDIEEVEDLTLLILRKAFEGGNVLVLFSTQERLADYRRQIDGGNGISIGSFSVNESWVYFRVPNYIHSLRSITARHLIVVDPQSPLYDQRAMSLAKERLRGQVNPTITEVF